MALDRRRLLHSGAAALGAVALSGAVPPGAAARAGAVGSAPGGAPATGKGASASPLYPAVGPGTAFLDHRSLLGTCRRPSGTRRTSPSSTCPTLRSGTPTTTGGA
ncbi:hypothetical protein ACR6C2_40915 [Streptomyces sp. INA 01156]